MKHMLCIPLWLGMIFTKNLWAYTPPSAAVSRLDSYRSYSELTSAASSMDIEEYTKNLTTWQMSHGGFYKDFASKYVRAWNSSEARSGLAVSGAELGTIDNNATVQEMRLLAVRYKSTTNATNKTLFRSSFQKALGFLQAAQLSKGGWPQMYPKRGNYSDMATYNDNAMIRVMVLAKDVVDKKAPFDSDIATDAQRAQLQTALEKAVDFALQAQIVNNGKRTVWCAQHDPSSYQPVAARSYELASKSGSESAGIVWFLMNWPDQSSAVQNAVKGALEWYRKNRVADLKYSSGNFVNASGAALWYRFYEVTNDNYFFCDREGASTKTQDITKLSDDRRYGYQWAGDYGSALLNAEAAYLAAIAGLSSSSSTSSSSSAQRSSSSFLSSSSAIPSSSSASLQSSSSVVTASSSSAAAPECQGFPCAVVIQGEDFCFADGVQEDKNGGFSGTGYVNGENATGAVLDYAITVSGAGIYDLFIRYANGTTAARSVRIFSGEQILAETVDFPTTETWSSWQTIAVPLSLTAGHHVIRLEALSDDGPPNVDWLGWNTGVSAATSCTAPPTRVLFSQPGSGPFRSWNEVLAAYPQGRFSVRIRDLSGRLLKEMPSHSAAQLSPAPLNQGVYVIEVIQGKQLLASFPARL